MAIAVAPFKLPAAHGSPFSFPKIPNILPVAKNILGNAWTFSKWGVTRALPLALPFVAPIDLTGYNPAMSVLYKVGKATMTLGLVKLVGHLVLKSISDPQDPKSPQARVNAFFATKPGRVISFCVTKGVVIIPALLALRAGLDWNDPSAIPAAGAELLPCPFSAAPLGATFAGESTLRAGFLAITNLAGVNFLNMAVGVTPRSLMRLSSFIPWKGLNSSITHISYVATALYTGVQVGAKVLGIKPKVIHPPVRAWTVAKDKLYTLKGWEGGKVLAKLMMWILSLVTVGLVPLAIYGLARAHDRSKGIK